MVKDRSHWLENSVYLELVRRYRDVYIGKAGNLEVDFVVTDNDGYNSYFENIYLQQILISILYTTE